MVDDPLDSRCQLGLAPNSKDALVADQIGPLYAIPGRHLDCVDVGKCSEVGLLQHADLGSRVALQALHWCSMMSCNPVGFGYARVSTSSVVPQLRRSTVLSKKQVFVALQRPARKRVIFIRMAQSSSENDRQFTKILFLI